MGAGSTTKNVTSSLKPYSFNSPYASTSVGKHSISYNPITQPGQQSLISQLPANEASLTTDYLPQSTQAYHQAGMNYANTAGSMTPEALYHNPFYDSTYNMEMAPINREYHKDQATLSNDLNSQNQIGGSYDALKNNELNQNYQYQADLAGNQARQDSANAYTQSLGQQYNAANLLGSQVGTYGNLMGQYQNAGQNLENQIMAPMSQYQSYQATLNPLQQQQANYYQNLPTGFQNFMGSAGSALNSFNPILGSAFTAAGNIGGNPYAAGNYPYGGYMGGGGNGGQMGQLAQTGQAAAGAASMLPVGG